MGKIIIIIIIIIIIDNGFLRKEYNFNFG